MHSGRNSIIDSKHKPVAQYGRAGRYIKQISGYSAFIPAPLPPDPPIRIDNQLLELLSDADRALGRLDGATEILPNPDLFVIMYVRKEAVLSSQIEGTQASLVDVLEFEAKALEVQNTLDVEEVLNYQNAMRYGLDRLAKLPLSLRLIREIHERLMSGVRGSERLPGEFRTSQNWIGAEGCTLKTALFVPPPPGEMEIALGDWEKFLHAKHHIPFLLKAGIAHAQFETIHPFLDGNGRVGRLLITFLMCEKQIVKRPLLYLSHFFKQHRTAYYDHLQSVRDSGDWEAWLKFFLQGVAEVANEATETAGAIVKLREDHRKQVRNSLGRNTARALELLEHLFLQPIVTVMSVSESTGLTFANANKLVSRFTDIGLLQETTGNKRNRAFQYGAYLDLF